ncbi:pilus assembly protein TadG-related protein [Pseudomonas syringae pv. actinidifoliorum]|nr:pilus assembly protein TadG-related protein [Pseudomonas syringae pv. actinidifoliorum]MDU8519826.1 pilus assembly protein TadG-related protein [Pseudomonas syringae pv. actinidifoliorum]MDU8525760.1 pilus assembly protein TadG-related protein [Pseudomonas syringae pv. actinidifoliorum]
MSALNRYTATPARQRGAIGLIAALTLGLALLCALVVVDSGRLYLEKRSLQRVADIAALEAAGRRGACSGAASAPDFANQSAIRNGFTPNTDGRTLVTRCGTLTVGALSQRVFVADSTQALAIQVVASHPVPRSIAAGIGAAFDKSPSPANVTLSATAVAASAAPLAALTIRSATVTVDSTRAAILNPVIGSLLGGSLNLSVANWQGLASTDLSLLSYLNRLKTDLNLTAVGYSDVLNTSVSVSQLIQSAISVLDPGAALGGTATIAGLQALKVAAGSTTVLLGDLLSIQGSSDIAALNTNLRLLDLVQGLAQVANDKTGISTAAQINVGTLAQVTTRIQVVEPPQLSAIGDPSKIDPLNPKTGANRIYVRTAQMRALVSINLPVLGTITSLANTAGSVVGSLTPILNSALSLNIAGVLGSTTCALGLTSCMVTDIKFLTSGTAGPRIDLSLSLASADTYVTGFTCTSNTNKTLSVKTDAALLSAKVGLINDGFPASTDPTAITTTPLPVLDIGTMTCQKILGLLGNCTARTPFGGGGIGLTFDTVSQSPLGSSTVVSTTFSSPNLPEINSAPYFLTGVADTKPSTLLNGTVSSVKVNVYKPATSNVLGNVITGTASTLNSLTIALDAIVENTLTNLLTTVVDPLFESLGLNLGSADVGANLSCNIGQAMLII